MSLGTLVGAVVIVVVAVILLRRGSSSSSQGSKRRGGREAELYKRLLRKSFGDAEQVERLIELERKKRPGASRVVLLQNALDRWERHNR
jgi:hypothetical protein